MPTPGLDTQKTHEVFYGINYSLILNQKQNKLELMLQRKQNMTFSTQLVYLINLFKF